MKITMDMMDAAQYYIEQTNSITFHYHHGNPALRLALRVKDANGKNLKTAIVKQIAEATLLKVTELMIT